MTLSFVKPKDATHVNTLLYGGPGTGKSVAAGSAPGTVLYVNADTANATAQVHARNPGGRIQEVAFEGMSTLVDVAHALTEKKTYDTVVVDTVGDLYRRLIDEASGGAVRPSLQNYGDTGTHIERFCRHLCEAPVHVVIVCHEHPVKDESTGVIERLPWTGTTNPALGAKLMGMVDVVGYTGIVETKTQGRQYMAQLVSAAGRRGKDRFDVLGSARTMDLAEWFAVIAASMKPAAKKAA